MAADAVAPEDDSVSAALDRMLSGDGPGADADPSAEATASDSADSEASTGAEGDADAARAPGDSDDTPFPTFDSDETQAAEADTAEDAESDGFPPPPGTLKEDLEDNPLRRPPPRRTSGARWRTACRNR